VLHLGSRNAFAMAERFLNPTWLAGGAEAAAAVAASGGLEALVAGLANADPQAACFAAAGVSALARLGGAAARTLAQQGGLALALLAMAQAPQRAQQKPQSHNGGSAQGSLGLLRWNAGFQWQALSWV
jgi:hypothetical protein